MDVFVGSSGRVFPADMKAAPLLRVWLRRPRAAAVQFHMRQRRTGWREGEPVFSTPAGQRAVRADAVVLALGGASWARLGSDGAWLPVPERQGVDVAPLLPANCGFDVDWSAHFSGRHAGHPLTTVAIEARDAQGRPCWVPQTNLRVNVHLPRSR